MSVPAEPAGIVVDSTEQVAHEVTAPSRSSEQSAQSTGQEGTVAAVLAQLAQAIAQQNTQAAAQFQALQDQNVALQSQNAMTMQLMKGLVNQLAQPKAVPVVDASAGGMLGTGAVNTFSAGNAVTMQGMDAVPVPGVETVNLPGVDTGNIGGASVVTGSAIANTRAANAYSAGTRGSADAGSDEAAPLPMAPQLTTENFGAALQAARSVVTPPDVLKLATQIKSVVGVFTTERDQESKVYRVRVVQWLQSFEEAICDKFQCSTMESIAFERIQRILFAVMDSDAATWARTLQCASWAEMRKAMIVKYGLTVARAKAIISKLRQGMSEKPTGFFDRVDRFAAQAEVSHEWLRENIPSRLNSSSQAALKMAEAHASMSANEAVTFDYQKLRSFFSFYEQSGVDEADLWSGGFNGGGHHGSYKGPARDGTGGGTGGGAGGGPGGGPGGSREGRENGNRENRNGRRQWVPEGPADRADNWRRKEPANGGDVNTVQPPEGGFEEEEQVGQVNFCGIEVAHAGPTGIPRPHMGYIRGLRGALQELGVEPAKLVAHPEQQVCFITAAEVGIDYLNEEIGLEAAVAFADLVVGAMQEAAIVRSPDLEIDDIALINRRRADGTTQQTQKKLKTGTVKELLRSFKTSVPVTKLISTDPAVREYLLYVVLSLAAAMNERIHLPPNYRKREHTAESWLERGRALVEQQPNRYTVPTPLATVLQEAQQAAANDQPMVQVPVHNLGLVERVATLLARPAHIGASITSLIPTSKLKPLDTTIDKRALFSVSNSQKYFDIAVDGYRLYAMNDSGSAFTIISSAAAAELGWRVEGPKDRFKTVSGDLQSFEGRIGEVEMQLHDQLGVFVNGIRVVKQSSLFMILGTDVLSEMEGRTLRKRGERVEEGGKVFVQVEVEGPQTGIWYNLPLFTAAQLQTASEVPVSASVFEMLVCAVEQSGDITEAFASADQADLALRWLHHHGHNAPATTRAFLTAKAKGMDVLDLKCPSCHRQHVDLGDLRQGDFRHHECQRCFHKWETKFDAVREQGSGTDAIDRGQPLLEAGKVVATVNLAPERGWGEKVEWLRSNGLWEENLGKDRLERRYQVFSTIQFGDCAWQDPSKYFPDLVGMESQFAASQDDIGCVAGYEFKLNVRPGPSIKQAPVRFSPVERAFVKEQMQSLLRKGVVGIAEDGAYLHRVVLVKGREDRPGQSGQDFRLCTDFRAINQRTLVDGYPAPDLQECLRAVGESTCFSSIDLKAGFHNIPIHKDSQKLVGVITQDGAFQFRRLQFGLCNAPSFFQKVVVAVVDKGDVSVIIYLDDIVIYGKDPVAVWRETVIVLQRLADAGFMINTAKSRFLVSQLKMLGYNVGAGQVHPRFPQLQALVESKRTPRSIKDVQSIYGLLSYFRAFVPNFAQIAAPISALLRGNDIKKWTNKHDAIVERVLEQLVTHAGLRVPNLDQPFVLEVACSGTGYGGVLLQHDIDGKLLPVGCVSTLQQRSLKSDVEQTLAATVYCLRKFSAILRVAPLIEVRTPVAGMSLIAARHQSGANFQSLLAQVFEYPVTFRHLPSIAGKVSKALSLVDDVIENEGVTLKPLAASKGALQYEGVPLTVRFDGGFGPDQVGVVGFQVLGKDGTVLATRGAYDVGHTSNHAECLAALTALQYVVANGWQWLGDYIAVQGDSRLVMNYLTREWKCHQPHLQEVIEQIQKFMRQQRLKVSFQWIPRTENGAADHACRVARKLGRTVDLSPDGDPLGLDAAQPQEKHSADCMISALWPYGRCGADCTRARLQLKEENSGGAVCGAVEGSEEELKDVPVRMGKRSRGRPKLKRPQDARRLPAQHIVPRTFACLACDSTEKYPAAALPLYCLECYDDLRLNGYNDPTEDLALLHFVWFGKQLPGLSDEQAGRVVVEARPFEVQLDPDRGERFQLYFWDGERWKNVPTKSRRSVIIAEYHATHGHVSGQRTFELVSRDYWWPTMRVESIAFALNCAGCKQEKARFDKQMPLTPCIKPTGPLQGWSFDLITDLPLTEDRYRYLLVAVDCFSKWVEVHPLRSKSSAEVGDWVYRQFLPRFGKPRWIRVDAGKEWCGIFEQICGQFGITVRVAASGYARTNGQVERFIREIKRAIRKYQGMHQGSSWWDWLPEVLMGLRMSVCRSHKHSPFVLMYKQDPMMVSRQVQVDNRYPLTWDTLLEEEDHLATKLCGMFAELRPRCAELLRANDAHSKSYHDRTTPLLEPALVAGDQVYRRQRRVGKLLPRVEGPFEFLRYGNQTKTTAVVWDAKMGREVRIHASLLTLA